MRSANREYSVGRNLEELYVEVFEKIYPQIKKQERGILPSVIYIILEERKIQAEDICMYFNIKNSVPLDDELSVLTDILGLFISNPNDKKQQNAFGNIFNSAKDLIKKGTNELRRSASNFEDRDMKLFQIVVIGCLIVGTIACIQFIQRPKRNTNREIEGSNENQPLRNNFKPVDLCLIVPAAVVGQVKENDSISSSDIMKLIDNCLYFLCARSTEVNTIQECLELTDESALAISGQREVYIRINVSNGEAMMGKKIPYILKRNLPSDGENLVRRLACIKYLSVSGLEAFNHV